MSKFLLGNVRHQLDEKDRMRIPAKFREGLSSSVFMVPGRQNCLYLIPEEMMDTVLNDLDVSSPFAKGGDNDLTSLILGNSENVVEDQQGRLLMPTHLKKAANIKKDVVVVGKGKYLELWAAEVWDERYSILNPDNLKRMLTDLEKRGV